jgi:predicted MFS family arabinose efflux permease
VDLTNGSVVWSRLCEAEFVIPSRSHRWTTVCTVIGAIWVAQSFARFSFGLLLPAMKKDLHIGFGLAGWLGTINLAGYLVGSVVTSLVSIRISAHRLVQFGTVLSALGIAVLAATRNTPFLLVGMALGGIGGAFAWIPSPSLTASVFPPQKRGVAMGMTSAGIGLGIVVAVALTNTVRRVGHNPDLWRPIWFIETLFSVGAIVCTFAFLRPIDAAAGSPPRLSVLRQVPRWWAPTLAYTCFGLGYVLFTTYVVSALRESGFAASHASRVFALIGCGNAVGALSIGKLSDRIGRRPTMVGAFLLAGVASLSVLGAHEPFVSAAAFAFGVAMSGSVVSIAAYLGDYVRPQEFGAAFGAVTTAFGVAQTIGPRLGGAMRDNSGNFDSVFYLAGAAWFVGAFFAALLSRRSKITTPTATQR